MNEKIEFKEEFNDKYCILKAEMALEQYIQTRIISDIIAEETDLTQKEALEDILKEEKDEFRKAKALLDECMLLNGNPYYKEKIS